jgi:hypothetical protein
MIGLLTGIIRMILDFIFSEPACGEQDKRPFLTKNVSIFYLFN